jgi:hypothetical protein
MLHGHSIHIQQKCLRYTPENTGQCFDHSLYTSMNKLDPIHLAAVMLGYTATSNTSNQQLQNNISSDHIQCRLIKRSHIFRASSYLQEFLNESLNPISRHWTTITPMKTLLFSPNTKISSALYTTLLCSRPSNHGSKRRGNGF